MLPDFFLLFYFPGSADHERDWLPCKVVFFGLATNAGTALPKRIMFGNLEGAVRRGRGAKEK